MSNLEVTGIKYIISDDTVNRSAANIIGAQSRIESSTRGLTQRTNDFDASLVHLNVSGRQVQSILQTIAYATGPLEIGLGLVAAGFIAGKLAIDAASQSFEAHQQQLANTTHSYDELLKARNDALRGGSGEGIITNVTGQLATLKDEYIDEAGQAIGDTLGRAILLGLRGQFTAKNVYNLIVESALKYKSPQQAFDTLSQNAKDRFAGQQEALATSQFVIGAQARVQAEALATQIAQYRAEGKSIDELIPKVYDLLRAKQAAGQFTGSGYKGAVTGKDIESFIANPGTVAFPTAMLSERANKLGEALLDAQAQYQSSYRAALAQHNQRVVEIDMQAALRRADIERNLGKRLADIDANLGERLADAEERTAERRADLATTLNERRIDIESRYQDDVRRVNEDAEASIFEATVRVDATALLRAKMQRERGLKDASLTRTKDLANASKDYEEGNRKLSDSLAKERIILERNAQRERQDARQNAAEQLADVNRAQAEQKKAEAAAYRERQAQLAAAYQERKKELIRALAEEKGLTEDYAKAIITSLKGILTPDEIAAAIKDFQDALHARIDITVTPLRRPGPRGADSAGEGRVGGGPTAVGALNAITSSFNRVVSPLMSPVMQAAGASGANGNVRVEVLLNDGMLDARIVSGATNVAAEVIKPRGYGRR